MTIPSQEPSRVPDPIIVPQASIPGDSAKIENNKTINEEKINSSTKRTVGSDGGLYTYAKSNTLDTVAYIILIVGIILMFFQSYIGQILVGAVVGYYFSSEIAYILRSSNSIINQHGVVKSLILGGALLAFFILSPLLFLAAAVTVGIKQLIHPQDPVGKV